MDDDNLSDRLARDLDATFATLVHAHQDRLFSIALRLLDDRRDAEEVAQDAFVRAYRALATYAPDRVREIALRPWLATIVVNLSRNRIRSRRGRPAPLSLDSPAGMSRDRGPAAEHIHDERATEPSVVADRRAGRARWAGLVAALPPRYREPVVLRHVDDLSYAEMARALSRPEGTLKAQVHRGLALLRAAYEADERATNEERAGSRERTRVSVRAGSKRAGGATQRPDEGPRPDAPLLEVIR